MYKEFAKVAPPHGSFGFYEMKLLLAGMCQDIEKMSSDSEIDKLMMQLNGETDQEHDFTDVSYTNKESAAFDDSGDFQDNNAGRTEVQRNRSIKSGAMTDEVPRVRFDGYLRLCNMIRH